MEAQEAEIFREVNIGPFGVIVLGEAFPQRHSLGTKLADNVFLLPAGFGGTSGIAVVLDRRSRVAALVFEYSGTQDLDDMVSVYRELLGSPLIEHRLGGETCVLWEDPVTRFEIFEGAVVGKRVLTSMMIDRASVTVGETCALRELIQLGIGQKGGAS
ncbi:hypothetical protein WI372_16460 [Gemmatimonadota bacterium DH-20]|uniref:Uncharacterized protein n=2 Tax=Gaopeijia maritima TaxID=3119007 RepID=A0ABU9ECY3_9BACT